MAEQREERKSISEWAEDTTGIGSTAEESVRAD